MTGLCRWPHQLSISWLLQRGLPRRPPSEAENLPEKPRLFSFSAMRLALRTLWPHFVEVPQAVAFGVYAIPPLGAQLPQQLPDAFGSKLAWNPVSLGQDARCPPVAVFLTLENGQTEARTHTTLWPGQERAGQIENRYRSQLPSDDQYLPWSSQAQLDCASAAKSFVRNRSWQRRRRPKLRPPDTDQPKKNMTE